MWKIYHCGEMPNLIAVRSLAVSEWNEQENITERDQELVDRIRHRFAEVEKMIEEMKTRLEQTNK